MGENDADISWYDMTLEEETEREQNITFSSSSLLLNESRRSFSVLSPLKEADRALEIKEESISNEHVLIREDPEQYALEEYQENEHFDAVSQKEPEDCENTKFTTPKKTGLGPRASQRHSAQQEHDNESPARRVKLVMREESPVSRNVQSRLGPRASSRHNTPEYNNKRCLLRDSPRRETDHVDKRSRLGTPTRTPTRGTPTSSGTPTRGTPKRGDNQTPTREEHVFRTPEIRSKRSTRSKKTPNSDSRLYARKSAGEHVGKGKDLFGNMSGRRRGTSESSKESEPLKPLTEEQIAKREKQVRYGKVTDGYQNYKSVIPKSLRDIRDPATPKKDYPYSKRCWDGLVRSWRRKLHEWDNPANGLELRAKYSRNNADLKDSGLINKTGEVVMYTPPQDDGTSTEFIDTGAPECITAESSTAEEISESQFRGALRIQSPAQGKTQSPRNTWEFSMLSDTDEMKSQDSEYSRLVGNTTEFPDTDSDTSYHLSQDSQLGVMERDDEEQMDVDEDMEIEQNFGITV